MKISMEELGRRLDDAVQQKFGAMDGTTDSWRYYVVETFDDYVIARGTDEKLYQIPYALDVDDNVQLGDPAEVETAYVPVTQSARFIVRAAATALDDFTYDVQVMEAGWGYGTVDDPKFAGMPQYYPREVIAQVAQAANSARFGRRHPESSAEVEDASRIAGWFTGGHMEGDAACATLHLLESEKDLSTKLASARKAGKLDLFGLSIFGYLGYKMGKVDGKDALTATKLGKLKSIDLVAEAGAGGKFRLAAGGDIKAELALLQKGEIKKVSPPQGDDKSGSVSNASRHKGAEMKERITKLLASLRKLDAGRADELQTKVNATAEEKLGEVVLEVSQAVSDAVEASLAKGTTTKTEAEETMTTIKAALNEAKVIQSNNLVETKLAAAKLPKPAEDLARGHLSGRVVAEVDVDAEITKVRAAFASFAEVGRVREGGPISMGRDSNDKVQLAVDGLLGVREALADKTVKPFRSIKEAYKFITGDVDCLFADGGFKRVSQATSLTTDFPNIILNSMTKRLIQDYASLSDDHLDLLINVVDIADFKSQDRIRFGYLGDLATVAENAVYTDFAKPTDEKISYTATKRGNTLPVSRELILNDDLSKITVFASRIARAGRRTLKQFVTNFYVNNPNYAVDSVAWFHATHTNLRTNPLTIDELIAIEAAIFIQTEKDSGKPLGLPLEWLMVPAQLKAAAYKVNNSEFYNPGPAIQEPNPFYKRFGQNGERIVVNELLTDANDFFCGSLPSTAPSLEVGFVQGVREPQIFLQNDPSVSAVFSQDVITYKVRHEYGGGILDYRPVAKNVVP